MELQQLTPEQLANLYKTELIKTFPAAELKPLAAMADLAEQGRYSAYALTENGEIVSYLLLWFIPGHPVAIIDYLGTVEQRRGQGAGAELLRRALRERDDLAGFVGEVEAPVSGDEEEDALRRRRLDFYRRNGFRVMGYHCALFGVHYHAIYLGREMPEEEIFRLHDAIYREHFPKKAYRRYVQMPLKPGDRLKPFTPWTEEKET